MSTDALNASVNNSHRFEAVLRISKTLSACRAPEELVKILADELAEFLPFNHLDVVIFKENSTEIEWLAWGKGGLPLPNLTVEELLTWHVSNSEEPLHAADLNSDERFPSLKQFAATSGVEIGSVVRVPLTAPDRRFGTLGSRRDAALT